MMTVSTPLMWTLFGLFVLVALALDFFARVLPRFHGRL